MDKDVTGVLSTLAGEGVKEIPLRNGETKVAVKVLNGKTLPAVLRLASDVAEDLGLSLKDTEGIEEKLLSKMNDISFLLQLIAKYTERIYALIAAMTTIPSVKDVEELDMDDILLATIAVFEVNRDFFTRRVLPLIVAVVPKQTAAKE